MSPQTVLLRTTLTRTITIYRNIYLLSFKWPSTINLNHSFVQPKIIGRFSKGNATYRGKNRGRLGRERRSEYFSTCDCDVRNLFCSFSKGFGSIMFNCCFSSSRRFFKQRLNPTIYVVGKKALDAQLNYKPAQNNSKMKYTDCSY